MVFRSFPDRFFFEGMDQSLPDVYRVTIVGESERRALEALQTDEIRDLLLRSIDARQILLMRLASLVSWNDQVIQAVREYNPGVLLPVEWTSITGDATKGGWSVDTFLEQSMDDPRVWSVETELLDGEFKFRADKNYSVDWGGPLSIETHGGIFYEFVGDPKDVFPKGTAQLRGTNIPAKTGRYRVTFNLQTFDYSFEPVTGID